MHNTAVEFYKSIELLIKIILNHLVLFVLPKLIKRNVKKLINGYKNFISTKKLTADQISKKTMSHKLLRSITHVIIVD